eukprot:TRINITY_DN4297_c0_g1_i6.p2 TRINITY_DN4297_c0_g1~~TRINITY_DN4297_c0_g1_i6.p2  ORF type:complete len:184 (-),score=33.58 TRINITY_DN4297_c0_g1_i6:879-1385(-)
MFSFSSAYFLSLSPLAGVALVTGALLVAKYLAPEVVVQGNQQTLVAFNVPPGRFPVRSQNPTNHVTSLNDWLPTSRVPFSVINENIRNFKEKAYRPTPEKGGIDMSTAIKEMQESVEIFGGHTLYDYYRVLFFRRVHVFKLRSLWTVSIKQKSGITQARALRRFMKIV